MFAIKTTPVENFAVESFDPAGAQKEYARFSMSSILAFMGITLSEKQQTWFAEYLVGALGAGESLQIEDEVVAVIGGDERAARIAIYAVAEYVQDKYNTNKVVL